MAKLPIAVLVCLVELPRWGNINALFILPHLGSSTKHTRTAMANLAIDNIDEFLKTGNCKNKVN